MERQSSQSVVVEPIHLADAVRAKAEAVSAQDGITMDEFVNAAVLAQLEHRAHSDWLRRRASPDDANRTEFLRVLNKAGSDTPPPGDEIPDGICASDFL